MCKFSIHGACAKTVEWTNVKCNGKSEDKADCPLWSGGIEKQTWIKGR